MLAAYEDKSAYAQCVFSLSLGLRRGTTGTDHDVSYNRESSLVSIDQNQEEVPQVDDPVVFVGKTHGTIVPARGPLDFG